MISLKTDKRFNNSYQELVRLNTDSISLLPLKNFAQSYRFLGGEKIPDETVNMIIRRTYTQICERNEYMTRKETVLKITQIIHSISNIKGKELWRLINTFCKHQYAFEVTYVQWLLYRLISNG